MSLRRTHQSTEIQALIASFRLQPFLCPVITRYNVPHTRLRVNFTSGCMLILHVLTRGQFYTTLVALHHLPPPLLVSSTCDPHPSDIH